MCDDAVVDVDCRIALSGAAVVPPRYIRDSKSARASDSKRIYGEPDGSFSGGEIGNGGCCCCCWFVSRDAPIRQATRVGFGITVIRKYLVKKKMGGHANCWPP